MKKIIVAFDNMHYSEGAMQFIMDLNRISPITITGVFLPQIEYSALWSATAGAMAGSLFVPLAESEEAEIVQQTISRFEQCCQQNHIRYVIHKDFFDLMLNDLKAETRYADLLVTGSETFYKNAGTDRVNEFLQDILHHAECPVMLVPEQFDFPQANILTYDGSEGSVFAIKQFSYLFPELCDNKTLVVYLDEDPQATMPAEIKLKDFICRHFEQSAYLTLHMDARKYLNTWLNEQPGSLLVSGSFGRSAASQLFKRSFIYEAITSHRLPVFITHK